MSAKPLHLNLLNAIEMKAIAPVRLKVIMPIAAAIICSFVLAWGTFVGVQYLMLNSKIAAVREELQACAGQAAESDALMFRFRDLQAEAAQFSYYLNGRAGQGDLLREIAFAIPAGVTLKSLSVPPPPDQNLRYPAALGMPPLQGPTSTVERVELRLVGTARDERTVFELMENFKTERMRGLVSIVDRDDRTQQESPRVLAFRQESSDGGDVFFDLVYDLRTREFVK